MSKYDFDKITDDIKRKKLEELSSGKIPKPKDMPDKGYDPNKLFRQRDAENGKDQMAQTEDLAVEQEKTFPDKQKGDRFKELRQYLSSMNMKK